MALRLVVQREQEIRAFKTKEYWTVDARLRAKTPPMFAARLTRRNKESIEVGDEKTATQIVEALTNASFHVESVATKEKKRNPVAAFITSTIQQEAARKLRFSVKRTMMMAQRLYEGIELGKEGAVGLITYMRTDSTRVSDDALAECRDYIKERYGEKYLPQSATRLQDKKSSTRRS